MTDFPAPKEELLTVAINDTAYAVFFTGITRFFCHNSSFFLYLFYIHEMDQAITGNLRVILIIHGVTEQQEILPVLSARYKDEGDFFKRISLFNGYYYYERVRRPGSPRHQTLR
jgi:hypothetical protein